MLVTTLFVSAALRPGPTASTNDWRVVGIRRVPRTDCTIITRLESASKTLLLASNSTASLRGALTYEHDRVRAATVAAALDSALSDLRDAITALSVRDRLSAGTSVVDGEDELLHMSGAARDQAAEQRDQVSDQRDVVAEERDALADERDSMAFEVLGQVAERDRRAALTAVGALQGAGTDRGAAAEDRHRSARDRGYAGSDRGVSADERAVASFDALTGAYRRDTGLVELERQLVHAQRTGQSLVMCFIDVDGLKAINDATGHAAGDRLLRQVADAIHANLRRYDLVVRMGGDEFACGLLDMQIEDVSARMNALQIDLQQHAAGVTIGLSALQPDDTLHTVLSRADEDMYRQRRLPPSQAT